MIFEKSYLPKPALLYLKLALPLLFLFIAVYGSTNWFSSLRSEHYQLYFQWELGIPFVPHMILVYLSIQVLFLLPVLHCDNLGMTILAKRIAVATLVAGIIFLLLPAEPGFVRQDSVDTFPWLFNMLYSLDKQYNLFPSLHITLSTLVVISIVKNTTVLLRAVYIIWLCALYLSVLLVHQHHIADIFGGLALAFFCVWRMPYPDEMTLSQSAAGGR